MQVKPTLSFVINYLKKYDKKGQTLLDIGCGTAQYRYVTESKYIGMDLTNEDYAPNFPRNVDLIGSAQNIPMEDSTCDVLFTVSAFYLIQDYKSALREFSRVLKPGGRLILFDYNRRCQKRLAKLEGYSDIVLPFWTQWELKNIVQQAGFNNCELLLKSGEDTSAFNKFIQLLREELTGNWAIVTGTK